MISWGTKVRLSQKASFKFDSAVSFMLKDEEIPEEVIKHMNVKYSDERCPFCNSRIDEYGYCACGAGGS
jgi:hypothetical protein